MSELTWKEWRDKILVGLMAAAVGLLGFLAKVVWDVRDISTALAVEMRETRSDVADLKASDRDQNNRLLNLERNR